MKLPELEITAGFYLGAALAIMLLPWNVLLSFTGAAVFHELCHITALGCFRIPVRQIKLGMFGAKIVIGTLTSGQELLCAVAGPAGSLFLILFAKQLPILALFGLFQGVFNLLPIYPLDGGRMLRSIFMLAKTDRCGYNRADYLQRGIDNDGIDSADSAVRAETGPVYRR